MKFILRKSKLIQSYSFRKEKRKSETPNSKQSAFRRRQNPKFEDTLRDRNVNGSLLGSKEAFSINFTLDSSIPSSRNNSIDKSVESIQSSRLMIHPNLNSIRKSLKFDKEPGKLTLEKTNVRKKTTSKDLNKKKRRGIDLEEFSKEFYPKGPTLQKNTKFTNNRLLNTKSVKLKDRRSHKIKSGRAGTPKKIQNQLRLIRVLQTEEIRQVWRLYKEKKQWKPLFKKKEQEVIKNPLKQIIFPIRLPFGPLRSLFYNYKFCILYFIFHQDEYNQICDLDLYFKHNNISLKLKEFYQNYKKNIIMKNNKQKINNEIKKEKIEKKLDEKTKLLDNKENLLKEKDLINSKQKELFYSNENNFQNNQIVNFSKNTSMNFNLRNFNQNNIIQQIDQKEMREFKEITDRTNKFFNNERKIESFNDLKIIDKNNENFIKNKEIKEKFEMDSYQINEEDVWLEGGVFDINSKSYSSSPKFPDQSKKSNKNEQDETDFDLMFPDIESISSQSRNSPKKQTPLRPKIQGILKRKKSLDVLSLSDGNKSSEEFEIKEDRMKEEDIGPTNKFFANLDNRINLLDKSEEDGNLGKRNPSYLPDIIKVSLEFAYSS